MRCCQAISVQYDQTLTLLLQTIGYQDAVNTGTEPSNASQQATAGPQQQLLQSESENRMLRHRLTTQLDQASQIESSLADVAQLTQVFTDQVMHQSEQIELLYDQVCPQPVAAAVLSCDKACASMSCCAKRVFSC